jgi:hypothetical protein
VLVESVCEPTAGQTFVIKQINVAVMAEKSRGEAKHEVEVCVAPSRHVCVVVCCWW